MADSPSPSDKVGSTSFEERWSRAVEQPELVTVVGRKVEFDLSPAALLNYLREIAETSRAEGEIGDEEHKTILQGSNEIERVLSEVRPERLQQRLKALKPVFRARLTRREE